MLKRVIVLAVLFVQISFFAQDYKFGKVSKEELEEKFYPLDSTADAAYLLRERKTYYTYTDNSGFEIVNEFHIRLKIYNKDGFDYATFNIPYYNPEKGSSERISSLKAYTYNLSESNKIESDKLSKKNIFDEATSKFNHIKKITMPNIKEGSVIELTYKLISPYYTVIDQIDFQFGIPIRHYSASIEIPEWLIFTKRSKGFYVISPIETKRNGAIVFKNKVRTTDRSGSFGSTVSTSWQTSKQDLVYNKETYIAENIPALKKDEPFVSNINNYRGGLKYELSATNYPNSIYKSISNTWSDVTKQIYKSPNFGQELEKDSYYKKDLKTVIEGLASDNQKVAAIFQFVKSKVKWNDYYALYTSKGVKKAYNEGVGNAAEINLMLTSMLRFAGLEANPVLVSTKSNGVPLFPTLKGFNYVISMVNFSNDSYILLDASEEYSVPNILPVRALNWKGRVVQKDGNSSWVELALSKHALEDNMVIVKISEDLVVEGLIRTKYNNLNALNFRSSKNHIKEEELITKYEENNNVEVEDFKLLNQQELNKPIVRNVKFTSEDLIEEINGKLYIEPLLFLTQHENPFKLEERKYPVDFTSAWKDVYRVSIQLPEGYTVEKLPEPMALALPDNIGVFKYQVKNTGNKISASFILQFNESLIAPQYYPYLKDFYGKMVKKESEKIVLVKM